MSKQITDDLLWIFQSEETESFPVVLGIIFARGISAKIPAIYTIRTSFIALKN